MNFIKKSLAIFTTSVSLFFLNTITSVIIARTLGPEGKGVFTIIFLVPSFLLMFSNLGISVANIYYIGKREDKLEDIVSNSVFFSIVLGVAGISLFALAFPQLNKLFFHGIASYFFFLAVCILPLSLFNSFAGGILLANRKIKDVNLLSIIPAVSYLSLFLASSLFVKNRIIGATFAQICSVCIATGWSVWRLNKISPLRVKFYPQLAKKHLSFGLKGYIANFTTFLTYRFDMFLVSYFLNPSEVGYYGLAVGLAELIWYVPNSINAMLYPTLSASSTKEANDFTPKVCRNTVFIVSLTSLALVFSGRFVINILYGEVYLPSLKPFLTLLPGVTILTIGKLLSSYTTGRGKPIFATYASIIALVSNTLLNLILIPRWGITGAAFSSTVAYSFTALFILIAYLKMSGNALKDTLLIKKEDFAVYRRLFVSLKSRLNIQCTN